MEVTVPDSVRLSSSTNVLSIVPAVQFTAHGKLCALRLTNIYTGDSSGEGAELAVTQTRHSQKQTESSSAEQTGEDDKKTTANQEENKPKDDQPIFTLIQFARLEANTASR